MSKPGRPQGGSPDAGKPQIYDKAPPQWTGVPVERDPVSGRLLSGDPLGRGDKGRSARSPGKTALITAAAVVVVAAVALTVFLVTRPDSNPDPAASAGGVQTSEQTTTSGSPTTTTAPPVETGPRNILITLTYTKITPPPGFSENPAYGTVGEAFIRNWAISGPCDGSGACEVEQCSEPGECDGTFSGTPEAGNYVARFQSPVDWGAPGCTGGVIDNTVTWTVTGDGDETAVTGSWVQEAAQVLFPGPDGTECGLYLSEWSIASL